MSQQFQHEPEEESINLRALFEAYARFWPWFLVGALGCVMGAWVYLRYTVPVYESKAAILIKDDEKGGNLSGMDMFKDLGIMSGSANLENEIEILKSRTLLNQVAKKLQLNYSYQLVGDKSGFIRGELYENAPITSVLVEQDSVVYEQKGVFEVAFHADQTFDLIAENGTTYPNNHFGTVVKTRLGKLLINKTESYGKTWDDRSIQLNIDPLDDVVTALQEDLLVESASKEAMVLNVSIKGPNIDKNNAILNTLLKVHKEDAIRDKNEVASNTSAFINDRMKFIAVELSEVESEGQAYKTKYNLVDVTTDAASFLQKEGITDQAITNATIQLSMADFMNNYIKDHQGYTDLLPSNLGFEDASIAAHINQYNELVLNRNKLLQNSSEKNPAVQKMEVQLASLKSSIALSLKNSSAALQLQLKKLKAQENLYQSKIAAIPQFEREYRDIIRQQQIKETLYLYLLQKREENEITLAATVGNTKIVDQAYSDGIPVSPKKQIIYLGAFLVGVLIPMGVVYLRRLLDNKVQSRQDVEKYALNVLAELPEWKNQEELFVLNKANSGIAEAFRALRSGLSFVLPTDTPGGKVISITSTMGGEGKTFSAFNLAFMFASAGQKVALVGFDLRKPRLRENLDLKQSKGVSNLLVDGQLHWKDYIEPVERKDFRIDVLNSGDIPPNPSELLLLPRLDTIIEELRQTYDLIILDNAPIGLVVDALSADRFADVTLYMIRTGGIDKRHLSRIEQLKKDQQLKNLYVVLNGVRNNNQGYSYKYGYGYGYGGYGEEEKPSLLRKLRLKK